MAVFSCALFPEESNGDLLRPVVWKFGGMFNLFGTMTMCDKPRESRRENMFYWSTMDRVVLVDVERVYDRFKIMQIENEPSGRFSVCFLWV